MIFVNFKTYPQGTGAESLKLIRVLDEVSKEKSFKIYPVVQASDIKEITELTSLEIWVQHIDPVEEGAHTGAVLAEAVFEDGAKGTFLNHSEKKFANFEDLAKANQRAKKVGLKTLVFAGDIEELKRVLDLKPDFVAYEPPELVGSTTTSVSTAHPDIIAGAFELTKVANIPLIVGAGVHSRADVEVALGLGAVGIAVATDIVKAEDPKAELIDLIEGFKRFRTL
jgi:triosephosphate isomerase